MDNNVKVVEFLSMLKDKLGLNMLQSEIVKNQIVFFKGVFSSGKVICGCYRVGIYCHLYIQQKDIGSCNIEDDLDLLLTQKEVGSFLNRPSTADIPDDQDNIANLITTPYFGIAWNIT